MRPVVIATIKFALVCLLVWLHCSLLWYARCQMHVFVGTSLKPAGSRPLIGDKSATSEVIQSPLSAITARPQSVSDPGPYLSERNAPFPHSLVVAAPGWCRWLLIRSSPVRPPVLRMKCENYHNGQEPDGERKEATSSNDRERREKKKDSKRMFPCTKSIRRPISLRCHVKAVIIPVQHPLPSLPRPRY